MPKRLGPLVCAALFLFASCSSPEPWETDARRLIQLHEGFVPEPYQDAGGGWSVGYGHQILLSSDVRAGRTATLADRKWRDRLYLDHLFESDFKRALQDAQLFVDNAGIQVEGVPTIPGPDGTSWDSRWPATPHGVRVALVDMAYDLGLLGIMQLEEFRRLIALGQWDAAAADLQSTKWCGELPPRCRDAIYLITTH